MNVPPRWVGRNENSDKSYQFYGGRGISVCESWIASFEAFLTDMGTRPSPKHSIERRDVNGNYCPENCYWAEWEQQVNNRRSNCLIEAFGRKQTIARWARELGLKYMTLYTYIRYRPENTIESYCKMRGIDVARTA